MKGVGAEHQMLMSVTFICECEHSHLYVSLISARPCSRATPFKKRKRLQSIGVEKGQSQKKGPPRSPCLGGGCRPDRTYIICIAIVRNLRGNIWGKYNSEWGVDEIIGQIFGDVVEMRYLCRG